MKNLFKIVSFVLIAVLCGSVSVMADNKEKKEKKQKEKKEFVWEMPELSGNKDFDEYLLTCDSVYNEYKTAVDNITWYEVKKIRLTDKDGNVVLDEEGNPKEILAVVDENNNLRGTSEAILQNVQFGTAALSISARAVQITAMTVTATATLPSLGLKALKYGKYVKTGPQLAAKVPSTLKDIRARYNVQLKAIRALRENYTETGELKDPTMDPSTIADLNFDQLATLEKASDEVEAELAAIAANEKNVEIPDTDEDFDFGD